MRTPREAIEEVIVDCYDEYEQRAAWEVTFSDEVAVPFRTTLLDMPVEVTEFRISDADVLQCRMVRNHKTVWVGVEEMEGAELPDDMRYWVTLYKAWLAGGY